MNNPEKLATQGTQDEESQISLNITNIFGITPPIKYPK
jgi:hypothetical protein